MNLKLLIPARKYIWSLKRIICSITCIFTCRKIFTFKIWQITKSFKWYFLHTSLDFVPYPRTSSQLKDWSKKKKKRVLHRSSFLEEFGSTYRSLAIKNKHTYISWNIRISTTLGSRVSQYEETLIGKQIKYFEPSVLWGDKWILGEAVYFLSSKSMLRMILLCTLAIITWKRDAQGYASNSRTIFLRSVVKLPLRKPIIRQVKLSKVTQLCGFMFQFQYMLLKSMLKIILSLRNQHENNQSTINFLVWSHGLLMRTVRTWAPGTTDSYSTVVTVNS